MKTRFSHAAAFGAAAGIGMMIWALIVYIIAEPMSPLNFLSYIIAVAVACVGVRHWRLQNGGYLTYGKTYVHLLFQTIIYAVISGVWSYVFFAYIAPDSLESMRLMQEVKMEEAGVPQAQIDLTIEMMREWQTPTTIAVTTPFTNFIFIGLIHLIVAAIMKKDPPPPAFIPPTDFSNGPVPPQPNQPYGNNPYQQPPSNLPPQP